MSRRDERTDRRATAGPGTDPSAQSAGVVLEAGGGVYTVLLPHGETVAASLRGRLKLEHRTGDRVVAGDRVTVRSDDGTATIEEVESRRSELARRAPGRNARKARVIVANVDQIVIVFAAAQPEPRERMLDRFLVLAEANELPALIIINKLDLVDEADVRTRFAVYERAGYRLLFTEARSGAGIDELRAALCDRESVLTGPSGVGKSSLLNAVEPGLGLRIGAVSEAVNKGQHTTVSARLIPLQCGGFVADTPGLRELGMWRIDPAALDTCFPEFREHIGHCKYANSCTHTHEPECAIRDAVEAGAIDAARFASYVDLHAECSE